MDKARKETDKRLYQMERELKGIYRKAASDVYEKWDKYMDRAAQRMSKLQAEYDAAKFSGDKDAIKKAEEKLINAKKSVTFQDVRYREMLSVTTQKLAQVNSAALSYVNDNMPYIYSINYNQVDTEAKKYGINFAMVDEATVKRLVKDGKIEVPEKKLKIPKDMRWNEKQINSSVLQGILQGESIPKISKRLEPIMNNNMNSAIRNARTMTTSAECHGRLDSYKTLEDDGVIQKKVWVATPDDRTRPTHIDLDGEEQDIDALFSNGCMFPGDGNGPPEEVWQCRCTIIDKIIGFKKKDGSIAYVDYKDDETTHEEQMEEEKERRGIENAQDKEPEKSAESKIIRDYDSDFAKYYGKDFYDAMCDLMDNCDNEDLKKVWQQYQSKIEANNPNFKGRAHASMGSIYVNKNSDVKGSSRQKPYEVTYHESGHAIDYLTKELAETDGLKLMYSSAYENGAFPALIRSEVADMVKAKDAELKALFKEHKDDYAWLHDNGFISNYSWRTYEQTGRFYAGAPKYSKSMAYSAIGKEVKAISGGAVAYGDLSDMLEGATGGKILCGIGHGKSYWDKVLGVDRALAAEAFAEMTSATVENAESLAVIKKYLPKSYEMYNEMLKDIAKKGGK